MIWNPYATQTQNGVPHEAPDGFRDDDFAYVISPVAQFGNSAVFWAAAGGVNGAIEFIAPGTNAIVSTITIALINPGGNGALSVSVTGRDITVTLAVTAGVITSTVNDVVTIMNANAAVQALGVTAYNNSTSAAGQLGPNPLVSANSQSALFPAVLDYGVPGHPLALLTIKYVTQADSIFIWTGLETPANVEAGGKKAVGIRIRYNHDQLSEDYLYVNGGGTSTTGGALSSSQVCPFPIFPNVPLPPQSLINVSLLNPDNSVSYTSFPIVLRGYKRRAI